MTTKAFSEILSGNRVCPMPRAWNRLWEMLPDRHRKGGGWNPPAPLILGAWHHTSVEEKRERFRVHLRWAKDHGVLDDILEMINEAGPDAWHTEQD